MELSLKLRHPFSNRCDFCHLCTPFMMAHLLSAFRDWKDEIQLNITSPTLTDVRLRYQSSENSLSSSAASPAIGTVAMHLGKDNGIFKWNFFYRPQVNPI